MPGADLDGSVVAGGADELLDGTAGEVLDEPRDLQSGEHDAEVDVDGVALAVVDRSGAQVVFAHPG